MRVFLLLLLFPGVVFAANILTWGAAPGATTIHIERKSVPCGVSGTYGEIDTVPATVVTYTDAVANEFGVCYRLASSNANGKSGYSNEAGKVPLAPANLQVQ
jgi:hypothetical protein